MVRIRCRTGSEGQTNRDRRPQVVTAVIRPCSSPPAQRTALMNRESRKPGGQTKLSAARLALQLRKKSTADSTSDRPLSGRTRAGHPSGKVAGSQHCEGPAENWLQTAGSGIGDAPRSGGSAGKRSSAQHRSTYSRPSAPSRVSSRPSSSRPAQRSVPSTSSRTGYPQSRSTSNRASSATSTQKRTPGAPAVCSGRPQYPRTPTAASRGRGTSRTSPAISARRPAARSSVDELRNAPDNLRHLPPPHFTSPLFTSTRTNLSRPSSNSPERPEPTPGGPPRLNSNSSALFQLYQDAGVPCSGRSPQREDSGVAGAYLSPSRGNGSQVSPTRSGDDVVWEETKNRAEPLGKGGSLSNVVLKPSASLPKVNYPRTTLFSRRRPQAAGSRDGQRVTPRLERNPSHGTPPGHLVSGGGPAGRGRSAAPTRTSGEGVEDEGGASGRRSSLDDVGTPPSPVLRQLATINYQPRSRYLSRLLARSGVTLHRRRPFVPRPRDVQTQTRRVPDTGSVLTESGANRRPRSDDFSDRVYGHCSPCRSSDEAELDRSADRADGSPARSPGRSATSVVSPPGRQASRKSILRTSSNTSHEAAPRYAGYDWVSSMMGLAAPLPKPKRKVEELRQFRDKHFKETHSKDAWTNVAKTSAEKPEHRCVHEFYVNSRLFPLPLYTDSDGRSQCPVCRAVTGDPFPRRRRSRSPTPQASPARKRSSVSWHDQVHLSPSPDRPCSRCQKLDQRSRSLSAERTPHGSRSRGQSGSPRQGRTAERGARGRRARSRSPVLLRSRAPSSVQAMFTLPTALFDTPGGAGVHRSPAARQQGVSLGPRGYDWRAETFPDRDPLDWAGWSGQRPTSDHPLWPRQLNHRPGVRPIARGWPGDPGRVRSAGSTATSSSAGSRAAARGDTYSLRRCIGEKR